ncbi:MAG: carbohydrate kinase family protein [Mogibacterium sp.]|nr:carbohydrate kinase family protein [Mogibacterium sp.]
MKYDVICIGMAILDSMIRGFDPEPVSSGYRAISGTLNVGGDAVNESIAASKLGLRTAILCSLGCDPAGDMIAEELKRRNVDTGLIVRSAEHPTPVTTIFVMDDGNRRSITNEAHRYNFHPEQYRNVLTETRAVILGSLFRAPFNDPDVIHSVLTAASESGATVIADTKLPNFRRLTLEDIADSLPLIDYLTPNEDEAKFYTGKEDPQEMAEVFLSSGVRNVIIKLGARGCYYAGTEGNIYVPAFNVDTVDATGAGDNFIAGFASEILRGSTVKQALEFASACGAICSTAVGSGTALDSREQITAFLAEFDLSDTADYDKTEDRVNQSIIQTARRQRRRIINNHR